MMNEVNWKDVFFITQILLMLGAFCGQIPFCAGVLMFELAILWFVILPIFILVCINVIFGGEVCFIATLLTIAIAIYYLVFQRRWIK